MTKIPISLWPCTLDSLELVLFLFRDIWRHPLEAVPEGLFKDVADRQALAVGTQQRGKPKNARANDL